MLSVVLLYIYISNTVPTASGTANPWLTHDILLLHHVNGHNFPAAVRVLVQSDLHGLTQFIDCSLEPF